MKRTTNISLFLGFLMAGAISCSSPVDPSQPNQEVSVSVAAPLSTPLDGIYYDTVCTHTDPNGQTEQVEFHQFVPLHQGNAPQSMLPSGAGSDHAFADFFATIPAPATCDVTATAGNLDQNGNFVPSDECKPAHSSFTVTESNTTETVMVVQCKGDSVGAGDEVVVVNEGPTIESLDIDKFVCVNEPREITANVTDPEGDATTCQWQVISTPNGASGTMTPAVTTDPPGHSSTFVGDTIGDYQVQLTCTDAMDGIESTLQFPMHVIDCGCECPQGYEPTPEGDGCMVAYNYAAISSGTVYQVCKATMNRNYSYLGAEYPNGTMSPSDAPNDYWGLGHWQPSTDQNARLNAVGVWACDSSSSNGGGLFPDEDPIDEWIGFAVCINVPKSGDYLVGLGADNHMRFCVNGNCPFVWDQTNIENFTKWHIRKIHLQSGLNVISVEGRNAGQVAAFGAEISGPFPAGTIDTDAQMMAADFDGHKIFSTLDMVGHEFTVGEESGYHCPGGFAVNVCGDKPTCTLVSHVDCNSRVVCCQSKFLPGGAAYLDSQSCSNIEDGHVVADSLCK